MIRTMIVDDENQGQVFLERVIKKYYPELTVIGCAGSVSEALALISKGQPQLIFLDIMLHHESGFDLLEQMGKIEAEIIFTTAHNEFAVKAFRYNALDYLLKPIDLDELESAVAKAKQKIATAAFPAMDVFRNFFEAYRNPSKKLNKLSLPTPDGFTLIPLEEIIYCESFSNYTNFYLVNNRKITSSHTLKEYSEMLEEQNFFRSHKSYLVNLAHVSRYIKGEGGMLLMSNGHEIEVSRRNKEALIKILKC